MSTKYLYSLLVVDDEVGVTNSLYRQLHKKYLVFTANNVKDGLKIMEKNNIQIVISDQRMPEMTGLDFFTLIKDKYPTAIKIMISGYSDIEAIIGAINEGQLYRYISKPWDREELEKLIADAIEKYELITKNKRLLDGLKKYDLQLEENLKVQKEKYLVELKFSRLFQNMSQGVFYQSANGLFIDVNQAALDMFGLTREQFLGKSSHDPNWHVISEGGQLIPPKEHPSMVALRTGQAVNNFTLGIYHHQN